MKVDKMSDKMEDAESMDKKEPHEDHEAKGWMNTIMEAEAIKCSSEKMKRVGRLAKSHKKMVGKLAKEPKIRSIKDMKDVAQEKYGAKEDE